MISKGTFLNVVDNSGAKKALCIQVVGGYRKRYAKIGDLVVVTIKALRSKRRQYSKVKKGEVLHGLVVRTRIGITKFSKEQVSLFENGIVLLTPQKKILANRIFGSILKNFRYTKYLRILSLGSGISN